MTFFIAMQNRRATASYLHPQTIIRESSEFLIVTRSGGQKEFLSISNAGASTGIEDEAPLELIPDLSIFATLVSQGPNNTEIFIVERNLPEGRKISGHHVGGDGYIFLNQSEDLVSLKGAVRLKPDRKTRSLEDRCLLLAENEPGATIHLDASYVPWSRELLPYKLGDGPQSEFSVLK